VAGTFRLLALLRVRRIVEDRKKRDFGAAVMELTRARAAQQAEEDALRRAQDDYNECAVGAVGIEVLRLHEAFILKHRIELGYKQLQVRDAQREVESKREELMEATRQREVVDKLHEKFRRREEYERNRQEEKALAETAIGQYARRLRASSEGDGHE